MCLNHKKQKRNVLYFKRLENIYNFLLNCDIFLRIIYQKQTEKQIFFLYCLLEQTKRFYFNDVKLSKKTNRFLFLL